MPTVTRCPSCDRALQVPDDLLGQLVQCPSCGNTFTASAGSPAARPSPPPPAGTEGAPQGSGMPPPYVPVEMPADRTEPYPRRPRFDDEGDEEDDYGGPRRPRWGSRSAALAAVSGPATALMVTGGLALGLSILALCLNLVIGGQLVGQRGGQFGGGGPFGGGPFGGPRNAAEPFVNIVGAIISTCWGGIVLSGAMRMKSLQSYGYAMTGAIVAMLPCSGCCLLGLPFGIWALVVLNKPEVKDAFDRPMEY